MNLRNLCLAAASGTVGGLAAALYLPLISVLFPAQVMPMDAIILGTIRWPGVAVGLAEHLLVSALGALAFYGAVSVLRYSARDPIGKYLGMTMAYVLGFYVALFLPSFNAYASAHPVPGYSLPALLAQGLIFTLIYCLVTAATMLGILYSRQDGGGGPGRYSAGL
ncbi:hypothetical protein GCM10007108_02890 [Thermogymnomonas acidicola]|uniref:Uncharacterized protein n=1 Tax=Thermogymnomonas acidicola TaxID=399579 RepID=A0AA37BPW8_9ARCH|nr:hypothetical protein [Thermogymnomonas acidicola]GGM68240.1 hypothetical protein GCM10007108_02890 [Thermogymnomonas acidicola]